MFKYALKLKGSSRDANTRSYFYLVLLLLLRLVYNIEFTFSLEVGKSPIACSRSVYFTVDSRRKEIYCQAQRFCGVQEGRSCCGSKLVPPDLSLDLQALNLKMKSERLWYANDTDPPCIEDWLKQTNWRLAHIQASGSNDMKYTTALTGNTNAIPQSISLNCIAATMQSSKRTLATTGRFIPRNLLVNAAVEHFPQSHVSTPARLHGHKYQPCTELLSQEK